jgi:glycosyltransferase involved in cell wall biosynthesis
MRLLFLSHSRSGVPNAFDFEDIEALRGAERTTLYLAAALAKRGHRVTLATAHQHRPTPKPHAGVEIFPPEVVRGRQYDVAVSNNYARAFDGITAAKKLVWTHNPGFSRAHIRADWLAKLRHLPHIVHLSKYTYARSWMLPASGHSIIHHGMPSELLAGRLERAPPPPLAVFASYPGRNLRKVIAAWRDVVHPQARQARLLVVADASDKHLAEWSKSEFAALNIEVRGTLPWTELMHLLRKARLLVAPGHFQETFNLLSLEAAACGTPTVTMGVGALRERVRPGENGWLVRNTRHLGRALADALTDDDVWRRYSRACLRHPDLISWDECAAHWDALIARLTREPTH